MIPYKTFGGQIHCESSPLQIPNGLIPWSLRTTKRNIFEKTTEEDAEDTDLPQVGGKVSSVDSNCCIQNLENDGGNWDESSVAKNVSY